MNLDLEIEFSKADILKEVDQLKQQIDAMRPLPADVEGRVMQKLRLDWNYNSNAIEGNKLNYGETTALLMHGITAKGKSLKDHLDIQGHNKAIDYLLALVKDVRPIGEADVRDLHKMILGAQNVVSAQTPDGLSTTKTIIAGDYKTSPNHVITQTGEPHYYAIPQEVPAKMAELMTWYYEASENPNIHPVVIAALFHHRFVDIHPFDDGNGRMSRMLMNLILMRSGYPVVVIKTDDKSNYYSLLSRADVGDSWPFIEYISERLESSLQLYLKAARGGDIEEEEDIDKEIALFKIQVEGSITHKELKSKRTILKIFEEELKPLIEILFSTAQKFDDLFFFNHRYLEMNFDTGRKERFTWFNESLNDFVGTYYQELSWTDFVIFFQDFKNMSNSFDVMTKLSVRFETYTYKIYIDSNLILSKAYHEHIFKEENKNLLRMVVDDIKAQIVKKQANSIKN